MADSKISALTAYNNPDPANDVLPIVDTTNTTTKKISRNNLLGITSAPVGKDDTQTLTAKTLTTPTINGATLSGTLSGTYTIGGTPTFPASVVTLTGSQTLTNKILTSPTINAPTITNASITTDALTGFSSANNGTIYGIGVTAGVISTAAVSTTSIVTGAQIVDKTKNPYKFSVYRNAAWTTAAAAALITFDTVTYDTGTNYSTTTGKFTAPIAGFYHFSATAGTSAGTTTVIYLYKNGVVVKVGTQTAVATTFAFNTVSGDMQLAVNDFVQVFYLNSNAGAGLAGSNNAYFDGFLISAT